MPSDSVLPYPDTKPVGHADFYLATNATFRFIEVLADHGLAEACRRQPALLGGIQVAGGHLTSKPVAEAHGLPFSPAADVVA